MSEDRLTETVTTATALAGKGLHWTEDSEDRLGIILIPAKTVANMLGIGTDTPSRIEHLFAWDQELMWHEGVKDSVPIGEFRVLSHEFDFESQSLRFLVNHPSLPHVSPGALVPVLGVELRTSNPESATVQRL